MCERQTHPGVYMKVDLTLFSTPEYIEDNKNTDSSCAKPRLKLAVRNQIEIVTKSLDDFLPEDHKVRLVWDYVKNLDLSQILGKIKSVESGPGAPAIDPYILMSLWLYAFIEGIISAKTINRYCAEHIAFKWLCGGVSVNEHTISDFRTAHGEAFDDLLTQSIGVLLNNNLISIKRYAQDGMKIEAHAGKSSFRSEKTLKKHLKEAELYVKTLKKEHMENPGAVSLKQAAARKRAAEDKVQRTKRALEELKKLREQKMAAAKKKGRSFTEEDKKEVRVSITDPEARVMKMPNSGFAPAYNAQLAADANSKAIVGVNVVQAGHDYGQLCSMKKQVEERLGHPVAEILADQGFLEHGDVDKASQTSDVYIPCETIANGSKKFQSINEMKARMETEKGKEIYKERASTAEYVNARIRTRGLTQVIVKGVGKTQVVVTLFAIGHNMLLWMSNL